MTIDMALLLGSDVFSSDVFSSDDRPVIRWASTGFRAGCLPGSLIDPGDDGVRVHRAGGVDPESGPDLEWLGGCLPAFPFRVGQQFAVDGMARVARFVAPASSFQRGLAPDLHWLPAVCPLQALRDEVADAATASARSTSRPRSKRAPVASSTRLPFTRGARTPAGPAEVVILRGWWWPLRTTRRRPRASRSSANPAIEASSFTTVSTGVPSRPALVTPAYPVTSTGSIGKVRLPRSLRGVDPQVLSIDPIQKPSFQVHRASLVTCICCRATS